MHERHDLPPPAPQPAAPQRATTPTDERSVTCPTCKGRAPWQGNPHRPFCGLVCRLIDLGAWLDERYRMPSKDASNDVP